MDLLQCAQDHRFREYMRALQADGDPDATKARLVSDFNEAILAHLARTGAPGFDRDGLTGAQTRPMLLRRIGQALIDNQPLRLLLLNVAGMRGFLDVHSLPAGDHLLRALGAHFSELAGPERIWRYGGDSFVIEADPDQILEIPDLSFVPDGTGHGEARCLPRAQMSFQGVRVQLRFAWLGLEPDFARERDDWNHGTLDTRQWRYRELADDAAVLLLERALIEACIEGRHFHHRLSPDSLSVLSF